MARQVLPWVGAAVGAWIGGPTGAQWGFAIGSAVGNIVDPPVIKGPALGEGQNNTASEGGYRPIVLGKGAVGVCMIHQGPEIIRTVRTRQSKGGGPKTEQDRRYRTMAFALGESAYPETGVQLLRLWFDNKLVYDVTPTSQIVAESAEFAQRFTFYPGNETQEPDPDLEAMPVENGGGVGNVPSYRGGCPYIVLPEYDVTDSGGRAPMIKAELASAWENGGELDGFDPARVAPGPIYSNGNRTAEISGAGAAGAQSNVFRGPNKYYCEFVLGSGLVQHGATDFGLSDATFNGGAAAYVDGVGILTDGRLFAYDGYHGYYLPPLNPGDVLMFAYSGEDGDVWIGRNGLWQGTWPTLPVSPVLTGVPGPLAPAFADLTRTGTPTTVNVREADMIYPIPPDFRAWFSIDSSFGEPVPLSTIATWIHDRVNVPTGKYNVSELTDLVEGIVFADGYTGQTAMQSLMSLYFFGAGEYDAGSGYKLNYVKRGKPAVITLTEDDIVEGPEDWEREDSYERPRVLHVQYPNPIADYGAPNIVIKRTSPDVLVVGERSVSVPVVFSDVDEITRRADVMMTVVYTEIAGTYKLVLPWSLLTLSPTDAIGFSIRGRTRRLRLDQWRFSPDGTISTEFMADRQSAWTSNVTGLPAVPSKPPPPSIVGPTISAVLDIPTLADSLDSLHLIVAATGASPAWYGADHQRKLPSDADYTTMLRFSGVTTIMGVLQDDVSDASEHFTDTTNVVRVQLYRDDELLTYTQEQFLSENGAFALAWDDGGVRRWEVCQYRDAVKVGEAEWELTTLQRGRLNTMTASHPAGSMFVLLDEGVRAMPMQSPMLGQDVTHRAVSLGQLPDQAVPYTEEYTGESQREWPVANLIAALNGDDLEIAWIPRHRFGTDDAPIASQNWRGYRVSATDGVNTLTAETTVEGHTFDVTGWSTPIDVSVSQLNRITGEGPAVTEEVA